MTKAILTTRAEVNQEAGSHADVPEEEELLSAELHRAGA